MRRTNYCGELSKENVGQKVTLMGWVNACRDHGEGLVFLDLRDRVGMVQVVLDPKIEGMAGAKDIRNEYVIEVEGQVNARPEGMVNKDKKTGAIEIVGSTCKILNASEPLPIHIGDAQVGENLKLKYRYLELRSRELQQNLMTRHKVCQSVRNHLSGEGFIEVETPILYKSTPEGARDYLVPSRVHKGQFYALPQSPQTLKQLLMVSGMDRYFQIAKCFRDEDLRADRQPEFTQIDIEMSFIEQEDVLSMTEKMARQMWQDIKGEEIGEIPRMSYDEAMERFGSDKPDLRNPIELKNLKDVLVGKGFKVFDQAVENGGLVKGIAIPKAGSYSRSAIDKLTKEVKHVGGKGLVWIKKTDDGKFNSPIAKFVEPSVMEDVFTSFGASAEDLILIVADSHHVTNLALATLRDQLGEKQGLIDKSIDRFLWVVDFPMFEWDEDSKRWVSLHHPFTMCREEDLELLNSGNPGEAKAQAYDLVCNGFEVSGGSVRIHRQETQQKVFELLGLTEKEINEKFGFFVEALRYGTPPHGGIAWGLDRICMILSGTNAIRDVIAFPKTTQASCLMSEAPSAVDGMQMAELGLKITAESATN